MTMILILLGVMDSIASTNLIVISIGIVSRGFEVNKSNNNIYKYEPEIKANEQIRTEFLLITGLDFTKIPKSKPIPIPKLNL
jgi:hypothetical protein